MPQSILDMAKDLILAQIQAGQLTPDEIQSALRQTFANLMTLKAREVAGTVQETDPAPGSVDWRKSITRQAVMCLECGMTFKQLSVRHLRIHGLDGRSYRDKYGIPRVQPLSAREVTAKRQQLVRQIRPWEKSPRGRRAQKRGTRGGNSD